MSTPDMQLRILTALAQAPSHGMTAAEVRKAIGTMTSDDMIAYTSTIVEISANTAASQRPVDWRWECETWGGVRGYEAKRAGISARVFYRLNALGCQILASTQR